MNYPVTIFCATLVAFASFAEVREGASYKVGTGVFLSDETESAIGLVMREVEERAVVGETKFSAQVYAPASEGTAMASAFLPGDGAGFSSGDSIRISSPFTATGRVVRVDRTMESVDGRVELLIRIPDPERELRVGDFVNVTLSESSRSDVTVVPESAILNTIFGDFVFVMNGVAYLRTPVETGVHEGAFIEIVEGLFTGDEVVVGAVEALYQIELRATKGGGSCH